MDWDLEFDEPIAERVIEGTDRKVVVRLGPPRLDEHQHWYCPYHIEGLPDDPNNKMFGGGIDAIDSIVMALANIGAYLNSRKDEFGLDFYGQDFLGFLDIKRPPLSNWSG